MEIRKAGEDDLKQILEIYRLARAFMKRTGNPAQWGDTYPETATVREDIRKGQCYLCMDGKEAVGVFAFFLEPEPTYAVIEQGAWLNDAPYGTIHRLAGSGKGGGVARSCFDFCRNRISDLRIDTHRDNRVMQRALETYGFQKCGIIYVRDHSERLAYQYTDVR